MSEYLSVLLEKFRPSKLKVYDICEDRWDELDYDDAVTLSKHTHYKVEYYYSPEKFTLYISI